MIVHHCPGGGVKIPGSTVVPQTFPQTHNGLNWGGSKVFYSRIMIEETVPICSTRGHLSLLENNLGKPCCIRLWSIPPRQGSRMDVVPCEQHLSEGVWGSQEEGNLQME